MTSHPQESDRDQLRLQQCPVQLQLIAPTAHHYQGADVVLAAACVAHVVKNCEERLFQGKVVATACPKIDQAAERYGVIIRTWCDEAKIKSLTVMVMDIPCCSELPALVMGAMAGAGRKVPVSMAMVALDGTVKQAVVMSP